MKIFAAIATVAAMTTSVLAQEVEERAAMTAARATLSAGVFCESILGHSALIGPRAAVHTFMLRYGLSHDQATVLLSDLEGDVRKEADDLGAHAAVLLAGMSQAASNEYCLNLVSKSLHDAELALARYSLAKGIL